MAPVPLSSCPQRTECEDRECPSLLGEWGWWLRRMCMRPFHGVSGLWCRCGRQCGGLRLSLSTVRATPRPLPGSTSPAQWRRHAAPSMWVPRLQTGHLLSLRSLSTSSNRSLRGRASPQGRGLCGGPVLPLPVWAGWLRLRGFGARGESHLFESAFCVIYGEEGAMGRELE